MLAFSFLLLAPAFAESNKVIPKQIDELFAAYSRPQSPGCSVGVIRKGAFIFQKSYGEASLELKVPLTSQSVFYMASVSKQFTAASVVLAAEQGFLSLDDDVRTIDQRQDKSDPAALILNRVNRLSGRSAGSNDILDHDNRVTFSEISFNELLATMFFDLLSYREDL